MPRDARRTGAPSARAPPAAPSAGGLAPAAGPGAALIRCPRFVCEDFPRRLLTCLSPPNSPPPLNRPPAGRKPCPQPCLVRPRGGAQGPAEGLCLRRGSAACGTSAGPCPSPARGPLVWTVDSSDRRLQPPGPEPQRGCPWPGAPPSRASVASSVKRGKELLPGPRGSSAPRPPKGSSESANSCPPPPGQELLPPRGPPIPPPGSGPHLHANAPDRGPQPRPPPRPPAARWAHRSRVFFLEALIAGTGRLSEQPEVRVQEGEDREGAGARRGLGLGVRDP